MSGGTNTTTSSSSIPPQFLAAYQQLVNQAQGIASQPLQQYSGDVVAGLSDDQQAGIQGIRDAQGIATPYLNSAAQQFAQAGQTAQNAANATWSGVNDQIAKGQTGAQNAANATWDAVNNHTDAATGIAGQAAGQANNIAGQAGAQANGIAGQYGSQAVGSAQQGSSLATQGALSGVAAANAAAGRDVASTLPTMAQGIAAYTNPYTQDVINTTQAQFNNQNAQQQQGNISDAIKTGAFGGDRAGVSQAILAGQQHLAQDPIIAQLQSQGFQQAVQQSNTDRALQAQLGTSQQALQANTALQGANILSSTGIGTGQLGSSANLGAGNLGAGTAINAGQLGSSTALQGGQLGVQANLGAANVLGSTGLGLANNALQGGENAASILGSTGNGIAANGTNAAIQSGNGIANVGTTAQNLALQGANAQMGAGSVEQQLQQAQLNVPYQQFLQQQQYPLNMTSWLSSIVQGLGSSAGGSSSTTQPGPNMLSQLGGLGLTAASLFSDERVKEDIEPIGKTKDGQTIHRFRYKGSPTMHMGLLAQEVEEKHPEAVSHTHQGIKMVDYKTATDGAVKRAKGGGISYDIPDLSDDGLPTDVKFTKSGMGAPKPPAPMKQQDPMADAMNSIGIADTITKGVKKFNSIGDKDQDKIAGFGKGIDVGDEMSKSGEFGNFDLSSALGDSLGGMGIMMRRGGGIAYADGGAVADDRFTAPLQIGSMSVPQLAVKKSTLPPIKANLTKDYGSKASDANGKSLLPSTTYVPPMAPWTHADPVDTSGFTGYGGNDQFSDGGPVNPTPPPEDHGTEGTGIVAGAKRLGQKAWDAAKKTGLVGVPDGETPIGKLRALSHLKMTDPKVIENMGDLVSGFTGFKYLGKAAGGGIKGYADGGAPDDDDDDDMYEAGAEDAAESRIPAVPSGISEHPIDAEPDDDDEEMPSGVGIAAAPSSAGRKHYASDYQPREFEDTTDADKKDAKQTALLSAGLAIMAGRSPFALSNVGAGGLAGVQSYQKSMADIKNRQRQRQTLESTERYRKASLDEKADHLGQQVDQHAADVKQKGEQFTQNAELKNRQIGVMEQRAKNAATAANSGNWQYIGTAQGPDGKPVGQYLNKKTGETRNGAVATKGDPNAAAEDQDYITSRATALANYQEKPLSAFERKTPQGHAIELAARKINPDYNETYFPAAVAARTKFASGQQGNTVKAFNVSLGHLATLDALREALNTGDVQMVNSIRNKLSAEFGGTNITDYNTAQKIVGDEATKAIVGSAGTGEDRKEYAASLAARLSGKQGKDATNILRALMVGQLHGLRKQYEFGTRSKDFEDMLDDPAKELLHNERFAPGTNPNAAPKGPPAKAVAMLKTNPDLASDFDKKYGEGAAKKALVMP